MYLFTHLVAPWVHVSPLTSFYTNPNGHFPAEFFSGAKKRPTSLVGGERPDGGCWLGMRVHTFLIHFGPPFRLRSSENIKWIQLLYVEYRARIYT
jgi:hypothetical protein